MPSSKRGASKAGPSSSSSFKKTPSSSLSRQSIQSSTSSSTSPSHKVITSLRRFPSQILSRFSPSLSSYKGKRKASEREVSSSLKGKGRAIDPPLDLSHEEEESFAAIPAQKRARIAAPEALGREESRKLLALLDSPARSERDWHMISLEEDQGSPTLREQGPEKDLEDDEEVAEMLGESLSDKGFPAGQDSRQDPPRDPDPQSIDQDPPAVSSVGDCLNGSEQKQEQTELLESQEATYSEPVDTLPSSAIALSKPSEITSSDPPESLETKKTCQVEKESPVGLGNLDDMDRQMEYERASFSPSQAYPSSEMKEILAAPISFDATTSGYAETSGNCEGSDKIQDMQERESIVSQSHEAVATTSEPLGGDNSEVFVNERTNGDTYDESTIEATAEQKDQVLDSSSKVEQEEDDKPTASQIAAAPSVDDPSAILSPRQSGSGLPSPLPEVERGIKSTVQLSSPQSFVNDFTSSLYPPLPPENGVQLANEVASNQPSLATRNEDEVPSSSAKVISADALTEEIYPIETEMLEYEGSEARDELDDAEEARKEPGQGSEGQPHDGEEEDLILIPRADGADIGSVESIESSALAVTTTELGETEDVPILFVESQKLSNFTPPSDVPSPEEDEGKRAESVEATEDEVDEDDIDEIDEIDEASLLPTNPATVEVIDFTAEDSSDDEEKILLPLVSAQPPSATSFNRVQSNGLLRGPLSLPRGSNVNTSVSDTIRALGRASLNSRSPSVASSVSEMFASQRFQKSTTRRVTPTSLSAMAKRPHIFEANHKARVRGKAQKEILSLKLIFQKNAAWLNRKGFKTSEQLGGWLEYKKLLGEKIQSGVAPTKDKAAVLQLLNNEGSDMERKLRRLLGKSMASDSRISIKPGKEQRRLRREALAKERLRRGVLGRPPLPKRLTAEQEAQVQSVLGDYDWKVSIPGALATNRDVAMLRPGQWMNDETITFYMTMINLRSTKAEEERRKADHDGYWNSFYRVHAFNSHFWAKVDQTGHSAVARWTRKVDLFSKDLILVPCNLGNSHWTCATINLRRKRIEYYDSMGGENLNVTSKLREYLKREMVDKKREGAVDLNEFTDYFASDSSPQQRNYFDCGVFVCSTLEQLSRRDASHVPFEEDPILLPPVEDSEDEDDDDSEGEGEGVEEEWKDPSSSTTRNHPLIRRRRKRRGDGYDWNFSQEDMPYMRRRIIYEISQKALLD